MVIVVMGPAGAGKSTIGRALAARLGWSFVDADDHHLPASVARMARGDALTETHRRDWLAKLHALVARAIDRREPLVLACSALTTSHRAQLAGELRGIRFVYLRTPRNLLAQRLEQRRGHFAGVQLLDTQLATLEEPGEDDALTLDGASDIDAIVGHIRLAFGV